MTPSAPPSRICRPVIVTGVVTGQSNRARVLSFGSGPGSIRYRVPARVARYNVSPRAAGDPSTGASTRSAHCRAKSCGLIDTSSESVVPAIKASFRWRTGDTMVPGLLARWVIFPSLVSSRKSESVVATNAPPVPAGTAAVRATPSLRCHRILPCAGSTPSASPC